MTDFPGSFANRRKRVDIDGEKMLKYKDVRGFRLHAEQGCTFWRFNIEVELCDRQQRIAYRINRGPAMGFWVPASGESMNVMFYTCNGFSLKAKPDDLCGPDPMWRDVLNSHQSQPFHVMVGGGDQLYNDSVANECDLFDEWLDITNPRHKHSAAFTPEMQSEMEQFYLERYCMWFSQGLFGLANSQIPMVNMYDDHDVFDGYGSYPHNDMSSPVFSGLGAVAFKYYMLFQHQSIPTETEQTEPTWIMGENPGPYIHEQSHSLYMSLGGKLALLAVDTRTERTEQTVVDERTWEKIMNRLYAEVKRGNVEHLLVLLGVPIAYPRLTWLENILTSRPVRALGKAGLLGKHLNNIDGGIEVLDDLNDHWTAKNHKRERTIVVEDLQDLAIDKSLRITILSGDVHLAAIGQFFSNPKLGLAKHKDPRYMPNIVSSAMVNMPPPDVMVDILNTRNRVHHFDKQTDESMIPIFRSGIDGKPRSNENLLPRRNWCSIRLWQPGSTPLPSPSVSEQRADMVQSNRRDSQGHYDPNIIRGQWSAEEVDYAYVDARVAGQRGASGSRAGTAAASFEFTSGDESLFTAQPLQRARAVGSQFVPPGAELVSETTDASIRPFHRIPTDMTPQQMRQPEKHAVNLEGGLDICLNVEVNSKEPTGITVPYRILVPRLFYNYDPETDDLPAAEPTGIKRLLSIRKTSQQPQEGPLPAEPEYEGAMYEDDNDLAYEGREQ
ncbi:Uncharacterized protein ESCO_005152 [Escovopsis weberi]|uniref:PhoD-like phosphatase domain-containing protein n=1 Tax=Escovopsis weberi TaxID=150374 RepID=A0A0M8N1T8_ESCWE|nr:Uncharacterized protein ESCO_005152 [Escovopsis weberi]